VNFNDNQGILAVFDNPDMTERDPKGSHAAFESFKEVVTRFPESKYAEDSAARMKFLVNSLAGNEVAVARYYMKRGAYFAAANRAQYAVQNYPNAPAIEEASSSWSRPYDALGMDELRDAADRVMRKNFPQSRYLNPKGYTYKRDVPWWKLWEPDW
jgi:outer membrane protein assembly factor BamD